MSPAVSRRSPGPWRLCYTRCYTGEQTCHQPQTSMSRPTSDGKPPMPSWRWVRRVPDRRFVTDGDSSAVVRHAISALCTEKPLRYGPLEARRTGVIWVRPLAWPPRLTGVRQVAEFSALPVCILEARHLCGRLTYAPTGILARGQAGRAVVPQGSRRSVVIHSGGKARPAETGSTAVASAAATAVRGSSGSLAARPDPPGS